MDIELFVPFDEKIRENHQVAQCVGGLISYWDDPDMVPVAAASHMRDDDYVFGVNYKGVARAYPMWVVDYYHIINDVIAGDPVVFTCCERCQSGSLFLAPINNDRRIKFFASGFYNATLVMSERRGFIGEKPSLWIHYSGVAISGKYKGKHLTQIPTYHYTWKKWKELHPDTEVMLEPDNPDHPDGRQGHGRDEYFSRPGMEIGASQTINGQLDHQYPENEMVLGIYVGKNTRAYPLKEVKKAGGVVEEFIGDKTIAIFAGPQADQIVMAAYDCNIGEQALSFLSDGENFIDTQTQSKWTIEGQAIDGHFTGQCLAPVNSYYIRWHAWVYVHKSRQLYLHTAALPQYPLLPHVGLDVAPFKILLDGMARLDMDIIVEMAISKPALPLQAERGLSIRVAGDRLNLYQFSDIQAAIDYIAFEGAWHFNIIIPRIGRKKAYRINHFIIESDPEVQYEDSTQICRLPDKQIEWSTLVTEPEIVNRWVKDIPVRSSSETGYFSELMALLKKRRFDVIDVGFLPQCQLYVGVLNGISATIEGYRYAIFRCLDQAIAEQMASRFPHSINIAELVFLSLPDKMHIYIRHESGLEPDNNVSWPELLNDKKFLKVVKSFFG